MVGVPTSKACVTCRRRKKGCDFKRPSCGQCTRSGHLCEGYQRDLRIILEKPKHLSTIMDLTSVPKMLTSQRQAEELGYFVQRTSYWLGASGSASKPFWTELIPQMHHQHPAVGALIPAFTSFYTAVRAPEVAVQVRQKAMRHYAEALSLLARSKMEKLPEELILTLCMAFAAFENLRAEPDAVMSHLLFGVKLLPLLEHKNSWAAQLVTRFIQKSVTNSIAFRDAFPGNAPGFDTDYLLGDRIEVPPLFITVQNAYECMDHILECIVRCTMQPPSARKAYALEKVHYQLDTYRDVLKTSIEDTEYGKQPLVNTHVKILKVHLTVACLMASSRLAKDQMMYDKFIPDFEFIVSQAESLLPGLLHQAADELNLGFIPPLFLTASRCRDPGIRRRAISVLHESRRQEKSWTSCTAARVARRLVEIEEKALDSPESCNAAALQPKDRIEFVSVHFERSSYCMVIRYRCSPWTEDGAVKEDRHLFLDEGYNDRGQMQTKALRVAGYTGRAVIVQTTTCYCPD